MKNPISEQIINHLEFLGYQIENISGEGTVDIFIAKHELKSHILLRVNESGVCHIMARYSYPEEDIKADVHSILNGINTEVSFTRWYCKQPEENKVPFIIETFAVGYDKRSFGIVIDCMESEIKQHLKELLKPGEK